MKKDIKTTSFRDLINEDPERKAELERERQKEAAELEQALASGDELLYVQYDEGYVCQKLKSKVQKTETIITKEQFEEISGIAEVKRQHGGKRKGAGRKKQYKDKVKETYEIERIEADKLKSYAKEHGISKNQAITEAINRLVS